MAPVTVKEIVVAVIIPLVLAEVGPWCGWLAEKKLVPWAAKLRYGNTERGAVRCDEWSDHLRDIPGQLTKLAYAVGHFLAGTSVAAERKTKRILQTKAQGLNNTVDVTASGSRVSWEDLTVEQQAARFARAYERELARYRTTAPSS